MNDKQIISFRVALQVLCAVRDEKRQKNWLNIISFHFIVLHDAAIYIFD